MTYNAADMSTPLSQQGGDEDDDETREELLQDKIAKSVVDKAKDDVSIEDDTVFDEVAKIVSDEISNKKDEELFEITQQENKTKKNVTKEIKTLRRGTRNRKPAKK